MRIALLGQTGSWYAADLARAASARGHQLEVHPFEQLSGQIQQQVESIRTLESNLLDFDAVLVRSMPAGSLEQVILRMDLLQRLEQRGVQVVNSPKSVECAIDKYLTTVRLAAAGIPVPATAVCETEAQALQAFENLGGDVVVKPLFGSEGRGIVRVSDPDLALRTFRTLSRLQCVLYIQEFIPHAGYDLRVMVLQDQVLGGMRRYGGTDFRTNISRQGRGEAVELTPQQRDWSLQATRVIGTHIAGIDLIQDSNGREFVLEVNGVPGWKAFSNVTDLNVSYLLIQSLESPASLSQAE